MNNNITNNCNCNPDDWKEGVERQKEAQRDAQRSKERENVPVRVEEPELEDA